jgi:hypothetical protein
MANLYETLGVPRTASSSEISAALRSLVRRYHEESARGERDPTQALHVVNQSSPYLCGGVSENALTIVLWWLVRSSRACWNLLALRLPVRQNPSNYIQLRLSHPQTSHLRNGNPHSVKSICQRLLVNPCRRYLPPPRLLLPHSNQRPGARQLAAAVIWSEYHPRVTARAAQCCQATLNRTPALVAADRPAC